jgi:hypothetical protein
MAKEKDMDADQVVAETHKLLLEKEQLELEVLRENVRKMKESRDRRAASHTQVEADLADFQRNQEMGFKQCNHHKGGKDIEGIRGNGTDSQYSIVRHQLPLGDWMIICLRCHKQWLKGDPEYREALRWPTDNSPSGSCLFTVDRDQVN